MSSDRQISIAGIGAVSYAGWGVEPLVESHGPGGVPETTFLQCGPRRIPVRRVPQASPKPTFLSHPRFRRASPLTWFAAAAAMEAIGEDRMAEVENGKRRIGIIFSLLNGCVTYSSRFFSEVLADPSVASPILFPETVFNAPASHLASLLGLNGAVSSLVGDSAQFIASLNMAVTWLGMGDVDGCVVVGAEEAHALSAEAFGIFCPGVTVAEGAGALYLEQGLSGPKLGHIAGPVPLSHRRTRAEAAKSVRKAFRDNFDELLVDDCIGLARVDAATNEAWEGTPCTRVSPRLMGDAMGAATALQCVLATAHVRRGDYASAIVCATGTDQQAAGILINA